MPIELIPSLVILIVATACLDKGVSAMTDKTKILENLKFSAMYDVLTKSALWSTKSLFFCIL